MKETKKQQLEKLMSDLKKVGGVLGSAIVSREGLLIASDLSRNVDADTFSAMSAAMQSAAETALHELNQGTLNNLILESKKGKIVTMDAGQNAILVVLAESSINLGLLLISLKKIVRQVTDVISG